MDSCHVNTKSFKSNISESHAEVLYGSCTAQQCTKLKPMKLRAALKVLPMRPVQQQDQIVPLTLPARSLGKSKSVLFSSYPLVRE